MRELRDSAGVWRKSTYSGDNSECVETAPSGSGAWLLRDTKHRDGGHITAGPEAWAALMSTVRHGAA